jgi:hypothetical protein
MIPWQELAADQIERFIAALIVRLHPGATAVDGAGGDEGADVVLIDADGQQVWEIKSFRERLGATQKRQIQQSLQTAVAKRSPLAGWTLVLPLDLTPGEQRWFDKLLASTAPGVRGSWLGKTALEAAFAERADLLRLLPGSSERRVLELVSQLREEQAALAGGTADVVARGHALARLADDLDPDYRADLTFGQNRTEITVSPKDPGATERRPIRYFISLQAPSDSPEAAQLTSHLEYGTALRLEGQHVADFRADLPPILASLFSGEDAGRVTELRLEPQPVKHVRGQLAVLHASSRVIAKLPVQLAAQSAGRRGGLLSVVDDGGALSTTFRMDRDSSGGIEISLMPLGLPLADALPAVRFVAAMRDGEMVQLTLGEYPLLKAKITGGDIDHAAASGMLAQLELLERVTDALGQPVRVPATLSNEDLIRLQVLERMLAGETVVGTLDGAHDFMVSADWLETMLQQWGPFPRGTLHSRSRGVFHIADFALDTHQDCVLELANFVITGLPATVALLSSALRHGLDTVPVTVTPDIHTTVSCRLIPADSPEPDESHRVVPPSGMSKEEPDDQAAAP